ncbi:rolling circle replication-associated protein [Catenovulum agarivorans]|uniref:rolling circle replication-associated protein n=1 Tax=Catenovulum agarivorans TaxID=1172192 RepID=UPI00037D5ACE|nr:hypothetical protein [Catenovulum agarivorans]
MIIYNPHNETRNQSIKVVANNPIDISSQGKKKEKSGKPKRQPVLPCGVLDNPKIERALQSAVRKPLYTEVGPPKPSEFKQHIFDKLQQNFSVSVASYRAKNEHDSDCPAGLAKPVNNRLVQRPKSPTESKIQKIKALSGLITVTARNKNARINPKTGNRVETITNHINPMQEQPSEVNFYYGRGDNANVAKTKITCRLYHRAWSEQFKFQIERNTIAMKPPKAIEGERTTERLTSRGALKIIESGAYVAACHGGFSTFLTLTFDDAARARIASEETSIGKEVSRFFDGASKFWKRGGFEECPETGELKAFQPHSEPLRYIWVAEAPKNKEGEVNPHCHVLLNWSVDIDDFRAWAQRLENIWGNGFAKLERIKSAEAASSYILKAIGYVTKGESKDQGKINGNRYNISKAARAPGWDFLAEFDAQNMAAIIRELKIKWANKDEPVKKRIWKARDEHKQTLIQHEIVRKAEKNEQLREKRMKGLKNKLQKLEKRISSAWEGIRNRKAFAGDWSLTIKGESRLHQFMDYAVTKRFFKPEIKPVELFDEHGKKIAVDQTKKQPVFNHINQLQHQTTEVICKETGEVKNNQFSGIKKAMLHGWGLVESYWRSLTNCPVMKSLSLNEPASNEVPYWVAMREAV